MLLMHTFGLWFIYIFVMYLKRQRAKLEAAGGWRLAAAWAVVAVAWVLDVLYNITWGSLIFLQPPHPARLTFTARLKYCKRLGGWRAALAAWMCARLLNPYDPGHC